eukprot:1170363-Rhodomonas_salina.1
MQSSSPDVHHRYGTHVVVVNRRSAFRWFENDDDAVADGNVGSSRRLLAAGATGAALLVSVILLSQSGVEQDARSGLAVSSVKWSDSSASTDGTPPGPFMQLKGKDGASEGDGKP